MKMKNLKNTAAAFGLMVAMGFGAVTANAGILISDKSGAQPCNTEKESLLDDLAGVIVTGLPMLDGIIIVGRDGILISDKGDTGGCTSEKDGIIIVGRDGILISD